ncbi:MAG: hypothetical protein Q8Q14_07265 [Gemmatimonadales bacterium]|nr:hypothetical protein [Gemmatimonadales bacterium]
MSRQGQISIEKAQHFLAKADQEERSYDKILPLMLAYHHAESASAAERGGSVLRKQADDMTWKILDEMTNACAEGCECPRRANQGKDLRALVEAAETELASARESQQRDPQRAIQDSVLAAYYAGAAIHQARKERSASALDRAHSVFFHAAQIAQLACGTESQHVQARYAPNQLPGGDIGYELRDDLMAQAEDCGEMGDLDCMKGVLRSARKELKKDQELLADVENVVETYFPELLQRSTNKGVAPEEKERRRQREERGEKSKGKRQRDRARERAHARGYARGRSRNPLGTLEDLPKGKRMWEAVYKSAQERGFADDRAARQAWGAVKAAGYAQDDKGVWQAPRANNSSGPAFATTDRPSPRPSKPPLPASVTGPLRVKSQTDGLWVVGRGIVVPVESRDEGRYLIEQLGRRRNPPDATQLRFSSHDDLAQALHAMDVAARPSRHARPIMFELDWDDRTITLDGQPDDPAVANAIAAIDYAKIGFDTSARAANPADGSRGRSAAYAFLGNVIGSILGFGLGALVGALAGAALAGAGGAGVGVVVGGLAGTYGGGIYGAGYGAAEGAPKGLEKDAKVGGAIGAAIPWVNLFTAPLGAYLATD